MDAGELRPLPNIFADFLEFPQLSRVIVVAVDRRTEPSLGMLDSGLAPVIGKVFCLGGGQLPAKADRDIDHGPIAITVFAGVGIEIDKNLIHDSVLALLAHMIKNSLEIMRSCGACGLLALSTAFCFTHHSL